MDVSDSEVVAEIDVEEYVGLILLTAGGYSGTQFSKQLDAILTVLNTDPRQSELDNTDVFISFVDVKNMRTTPSDLLKEIPEEISKPVIDNLRSAAIKLKKSGGLH